MFHRTTETRIWRRLRTAPALLGLAASACSGGGVVDNHYQGKPLAALTGQVSAETPPAADSVSLAIVWITSRDLYPPSLLSGQGGAGGMGGADAGDSSGDTPPPDSGFGGVGPSAGGAGPGIGGAGPGAGGATGAGMPAGPVGAAGAGGIQPDVPLPVPPLPDVPLTMTTVLLPQTHDRSGSLLDPPLLGCDGTPATVSIFDVNSSQSYKPIATTSVSFQAHFPLDFTVPITAVPPDETLIPLDIAVHGSGVYAAGYLVAFIDDNHNNKLDPPSLYELPDRILAVSANRIVYLNGVFPPPDVALTGPAITPGVEGTPDQFGYLLPQGFSLYNESSGQIWPANTPIDLPLAGTQYAMNTAAMRICTSLGEHYETFSPTQTAPTDAVLNEDDNEDDEGSHWSVRWQYEPTVGSPCLSLAFQGSICP